METGQGSALDSETVLAAVDLSSCSQAVLQAARQQLRHARGRIVVLHVIDRNFVKRCSEHQMGTESGIKRELFLDAKTALSDLIRKVGLDGVCIKPLVCEGVPYLEINRKAVEYGARMIVMGSCGKDDDAGAIYFGTTAEKVLRFIRRPVLCVPPKLDWEQADGVL